MSTVPVFKSHFASTGVTTPGFAVAGASAAHQAATASATTNNNTTNNSNNTISGGNNSGNTNMSGVAGSPSSNSPLTGGAAGTGLPTTPNYFTNASSSYQSHFGDFGGSSGGILPGRSASNSSAVCGSSAAPTAAAAAAAGGSASLNASGAVSSVTAAPAPIGTPNPVPLNNNNNNSFTNATTTSLSGTGSPSSAPVPISARLGTPPSSHGNSPHTASITTAAKFASPVAVGATPKSANALYAPAGVSAVDWSDGATSGSGPDRAVGPPALPTTKTTLGSPNKTFSPKTFDVPPTSAAPPSGGGDVVSPSGGMNALLFAHHMNLTVNPPPTTGESEDEMAEAMDDDVLREANKYAMLALSSVSGTTPAESTNNNTNGGGGVSPSPTSPAAPHSGSPSPTGNTPRLEVRMSPTAATQLSVPQLQQPQAYGSASSFAGAAPLTPLSAQSSSSRHSNPTATTREPVVNVYDSDFKTLLSIPVSQVVHRPHPSLGVSRLVLCRNYSPENPGNCSKGELCKFVHANVSGASRCSIHVNYAWRSLELCAYPRLPAGDELTVLAPNERPPAETIPSERILVTRGSTNWREHTAPLSHCAHYYFNRMCNRGERCNFIHAVHVDPTVQGDFKRAPAPTAVAPIVSKSPTSPALRGPHDGLHSSSNSNVMNTNSKSGSGLGVAARVSSGGNSNNNNNNNGPTASANTSSSVQPPPPPPPPLPPCGAYGFLPSVYTPPPPPPPPPGAMTFPLTSSPTAGGSGPYMMFSSGPAAPTGYVPATLVPPPPSHVGNSNGVYLLVPAHAGVSPTGSGTPRSPVSPLGQSLGSLSNGPIDWSFYGDLETNAWMPPSPSTRM